MERAFCITMTAAPTVPPEVVRTALYGNFIRTFKNSRDMQLAIELVFVAFAIYLLVSAFFIEPENEQKDDKGAEN